MKKINKNPVIVAEVMKKRKQEKQKGHHGLHETFQSNKRKGGGGKSYTYIGSWEIDT